MIAADNAFALWTILVFVSAFGMIGERKNWFFGLSGVIITISLTAILTTFNFIPSAAVDAAVRAPIYNFVFEYFIPISIPLLLFNIQLKRIVKDSGRLLGIFLVGALGVTLGAIIAAHLIDLGEETYKIAAAYVGTYTGGSVNFMAVAKTFDFENSPLFPAVIAVDVGFTNVYLILLFVLPAVPFLMKFFPAYEEEKLVTVEKVEFKPIEAAGSLMEKIAICFTISGSLCWVGMWLGPIIADLIQTDINLDVLIITILITLLANIFPQFFRSLAEVAFELGMFLMFIFLAVIGAASDIYAIINSAPSILLFVILMLTIHLIISLIGGKLLGVSLKEIMIASSANVGGVSIAAPMAATFGMKKLVTPAILIGILGYVLGTFLGIGTGLFLK